jgi:hypothetical protein
LGVIGALGGPFDIDPLDGQLRQLGLEAAGQRGQQKNVGARRDATDAAATWLDCHRRIDFKRQPFPSTHTNTNKNKRKKANQ